MSESSAPLVIVQNLSVQFVSRDATVHAVNGVSFTLERGEVLGILGESGSGKSVTLRALMRLLPARKTRVSGRVEIAGTDVMALDQTALARLRGPTAAMIFQEPMTALDPVFTIGDQIIEAIISHEQISRSEAARRALELLELVQIPSAKRRLDAYPHQLSGGLRQRAMIAIALACRPAQLLADEPTTALDAMVQIQVLLLLRTLQQELGMPMIFVTHDLGVAVEVSHKLAVMYAGRMVESGRCAKSCAIRATLIRKGSCARRCTRSLKGSGSHRFPVLRLTSPPCRPVAASPRAAAMRRQSGSATYPPPIAIGAHGEYEHVTRCHYAHRVGSAAAMTSGS